MTCRTCNLVFKETWHQSLAKNLIFCSIKSLFFKLFHEIFTFVVGWKLSQGYIVIYLFSLKFSLSIHFCCFYQPLHHYSFANITILSIINGHW